MTVLSVKERELPSADDDFAQIASQFDTIGELRADLREQLGKSKEFGQGVQARDKIVDELLKKVEIPVPQKLIDDEVHRHLEGENRLDDDTHRAEVAESSEKTFRSQILLDSIAEAEEIKVGQNELTSYLVQASAQYGMEPGEFIQVLQQNNQLPAMIGEVARSKALAFVLSKAKVVDTKGKDVDVSAFTASALGDGDDSSDANDLVDGAAAARQRRRRQGRARPQARQRALRARPQVGASRMTRYVALLRGVNVGGVNMKMADLAEVVRGLGYDDVKTVLASGNVLFTTPDAAAASKDKLEAALRKRFGYEAWVHVLTVDADPEDHRRLPLRAQRPTGTRTSSSS